VNKKRFDPGVVVVGMLALLAVPCELRAASPETADAAPGAASPSVASPGVAVPDGSVEDLAALEEVVVTATKQSRELSKVPISISAYTQAAMDDRGIRSIGDIVAQTPGLDLRDQGTNGVGDRIAIRGIDSNTGAGTTGVYIDDTPIQARSNPVNLAGTVFPEVFDLERVEVLRGPQGTLFGAGAEGGVVRFITPQPSLVKYSAYARSEVGVTQGGDPSYEVGGAFGGPLVDQKLALRISGWTRHDGGWVDRTSWETDQTSKNVNWSDAGEARLALLWQASDRIRVTPAILFEGTHANDSSNYWYGDPAAYQVAANPFPGNPTVAVPSLSITPPGSADFRSGNALRQQSTEHFVLPSLKIEVDLGSMQLTSNTSYFYRTETNVQDVTNSDIAGGLGLDVGALGIPVATPARVPVDLFPVDLTGSNVIDQFDGATWQNIITEELRLQNTDADATVRWVGGLFFQNSRLADTQAAPNPRLQALFNQQTGDPTAFDSYYYDGNCVGPCTGLLNGTLEYYGSEHSRDLQISLFGNAEWSITRQWILNAGLRVERTQSDFIAQEDGPVNDGPSASGGGVKAYPVTPKIGLSYQRDGDNLYYATAAKGYRPGGGNSHVPPSCSVDTGPIGLGANTPTQYDADSTWSYELGWKSKLDGGLVAIDASAYYIDWRNIQWYYFLPDCGYGFVMNLGTARSTGFDVDLNARLSTHLLADLAVGYNQAKFLRTIALSAGVAPVVFADQTLGQTPWTVSGSLEYRFGKGGKEGFYARIVDDYKSANSGPYSQQNPAATSYDSTFRPLPSTNELNLRIGKQWNEFDLSVFVNNALNSTPFIEQNHFVPSANPTVANGGTAADGSPLYTAATIRPRVVGLTLTVNY